MRLTIFSLIPASSTMAIRYPTPVAKPFTTPSRILYSSCTLFRATPSTAQFVVISGRYTPRALYNEGTNFFKNISTICTSAAITRINTIVFKYSNPSGLRINWCNIPATNDARVITKITAPPIPAAVSVFLETPRKEQIPRN